MILGNWKSSQPIDSTDKNLSYFIIRFKNQNFHTSTRPMQTIGNSGIWSIKDGQVILRYNGHLGGKYTDSLSIIRLDQHTLTFSKYNKTRQTIDTFKLVKENLKNLP
ncbi:hypothetical protein M23134_00760 [Microscilla marina ATCC 23134]|uniref:Lipocalin-like domain-containing protein n=1 Tax=Microscilla marina ATCC 23134 TaxID=313606 RepID=A1ZS71_MICM2|nr:hypothetical protein M23134_00760 [Microscilla marina ATCC 23134]